MKKLLILTFLVAACSQETPKDAIATVNGEAITKTEIQKVLAQFTGLEGAKMEDYPADFQKELVDKYIEKKLLLAEARDSGIANNADIKAQVKEAEDFLIEQQYLKEIVKQESTEEKMQKLYDEVVASRAGEKEASAAHILVKTEKEAKEIEKKLKAGTPFKKLAAEHSIDPGSKINGGELGYFTAEKMIPAFSDKAFSMKKGEISEPVQTDFGWHIIKLEDIREVQIPSFEKSKQAIKAELARRAVEEKVVKLKESADIKINFDFPTKQAEVELDVEVDEVTETVE